MSIVTKTGDGGTTKLLSGDEVSKADLQVEAYGTIDEWNSFLGLSRALCEDEWTKRVLEELQRESFIVGAELAITSEKAPKLKQRITAELLEKLDGYVAEIEKLPGLLDDWALPGATHAGAALDIARTVCRRAERHAVRLRDAGQIENETVLRYLNRASDLLWLLGRRYEMTRGVDGALRS